MATSSVHEQSLEVRPKESPEICPASTEPVLRDSPTVISQFSCREYLTSFCPTPDGNVWLCDWRTSTAILINNKSKVLQKIKHKSNIIEISLDPTTGRLWFCCWEERIIYEVFTSSPVSRFTTDANPHSLCVTREGRVVVGTRSKQGYKVVMYTADGQVLHTATVESSGAGAVTFITQCPVTDNIAVVNSKLISGDGNGVINYRRHIIVYNATFEPLVHYRGEGIQAREAVTPDKFVPFRIVYDSKGNIVIADWERKTIELISGDGKYIKTLHTEKTRQGVVGIQKGDILWSRYQLDKDMWGFKLLKYYSD
ncbi:uncharacterized protein LOC132547166 [Ylistrum balloti]|uniref:uncharacterized protein LOC132547166 n=1 Tax=Ylistrum balloti TaxID=509963 RepID=UPI002905D0DE|nr:uncharacterized protein LOC132547166 [Ylistrum balloti]